MAAEVAAGAIVAEEVVSTTVQGAAATYAVAKPTMPLKATFNRIATSTDDQTGLSLVRSNHTVSIVKDKAYIFGGETANGQIASNEIHSVNLVPPSRPDHEYALFPAVPDQSGGKVPPGRTRHAACAFNICVAVFGGCDDSGALVDSEPVIWLYNTSKSAWETLLADEPHIAPVQRTDARLFDSDNDLVLYGGTDASGKPLSDVWHFSYTTRQWTPLPPAPVSTPNAALAGRTLYLISASDPTSSEIHSLALKPSPPSSPSPSPGEWTTVSFPTNPLAPGPRARVGAGLVPVTTGHGRNYLLFFFGARQDPLTSRTLSPNETSAPTQWVDLWTHQIASSKPEAGAATGLSDVLRAARIKDAIRERLGYESGEGQWAEVEVLPPGELGEGVEAGKVHPGPRGDFGCDVMGDGRRVVFWGGMNAKGEREGDGWVVELA